MPLAGQSCCNVTNSIKIPMDRIDAVGLYSFMVEYHYHLRVLSTTLCEGGMA